MKMNKQEIINELKKMCWECQKIDRKQENEY